MKTKLIILMLLLVSGCAVTPQQRRINTKTVFLGAIKTINILKDAGRFSEKEIEQIKVFANKGNEILKDWEESGSISPDVMEVLETAISELIAYKERGKTNAVER